LDRRLHLLAPDLRVRAVGDRGRRYRSSHWSKCSGITIPRLLIHHGERRALRKYPFRDSRPRLTRSAAAA
jgi:hypothetical protein